MSIVYNWTIDWMKCTPTNGTNTNIVVMVGWKCEGISGGYSTSISGVNTFDSIGDPFIPYENLTQEQVLNWCWSYDGPIAIDKGVNKSEVELRVANELEKLLNPPIIQTPLPWNPVSIPPHIV